MKMFVANSQQVGKLCDKRTTDSKIVVLDGLITQASLTLKTKKFKLNGEVNWMVVTFDILTYDGVERKYRIPMMYIPCRVTVHDDKSYTSEVEITRKYIALLKDLKVVENVDEIAAKGDFMSLEDAAEEVESLTGKYIKITFQTTTIVEQEVRFGNI